MSDKKYLLAGQEFTLARPTVKRLKGFVKILDLEKWSDFDSNREKTALLLTNLGQDSQQVKDMLEIVVVEPVTVDIEEMDVLTLREVVRDFFSQLLTISKPQ